MKKMILVLVFLMIIVGCAEKVKEPDDNTQIANPASVFCEEQGGTLRIEDNGSGQYGICTLLNGTECEEWAYFRGECP